MKLFDPLIKALIFMALLIFTVPSIYAQTNEEALKDPNENSEIISKPQNTPHHKPHHKNQKPRHKKTKQHKPRHSKKKGSVAKFFCVHENP